MNFDSLLDRRRPVHHPGRESDRRPLIQFVTVCTKGRAAVLATSEVHAHLRQIWTQDATYRVGRYMIMPDHVHFFCGPASFPPESLAKWVRFWKSTATRTWPGGTGRVWQRDFWDTQVWGSRSYAEKWEYVRFNPVRAGLVHAPERWPFQGELHPLIWQDKS